jgi:tetratricopeptide (TPR) repeat protein
MGVLAVQMKQPAAGLPYFVAALNADPARKQYWLNYIDALLQAVQLEDARQTLALARQHGLQGDEVEAMAVRLEDDAQVVAQDNQQASKESPPVSSTASQNSKKNPSFQEIDTLVALFTEGRLREAAALAQAMTVSFPLHEFGWKALGAVFKQMGRSADALVPMQKAAALSPDDVEAHYNLGVTLQELGRLDKAEASYRRALQINPDYTDAHSNLGVTLQKLGHLDEAETSYRRALQINPDYAKAHSNLGNLLNDLGHLNEAEASLRRALQINPDYAEVHSNLGLILHELSRLDEAEASYRRALQIKPDFAEAHYNLGNTLKDMGRLDEAEASYRRALQIKPDLAEVYYNLGNTLKDMGRMDEAEASYRRALEIQPDFAAAHSNLGVILQKLGHLDEAEASYRQTLHIKPDYAEAHSNLGNTLKDMGRLDEAEASYRRALDIQPDFADAHSNLGNTLKDMGRMDEAEASYRRALEIQPDFAAAHSNLGNTLKDMGRLDEAEASYRRALEIQPDFADAHYNLGVTLKDMGRLDEAEASFRRALQIRPDYAEAHSNLGLILHELSRLDEAEASFRRALQLKPDLVEAHNNLGNTLKDLGRLDEAEASYRRALEIQPDFAAAHSNLGATLQDMSRLDEAEASYRRALQIKPDYEDAFGNLLFTLNYHPDKSGEEIFGVYQEYDGRFALPCQSEWRPHGNSREMKRRLKVGYVSPDFRKHSARHFLEPLLAHHDKHAVEVYAYAELTQEDAVTARYKNYVDQWILTRGLSDKELAERIRADGIDILVELAGHSAQNRLGVFARKPAPVSLSWMGYGYSTGLTAIDYFLTDEVAVPAGSEGLFSEKPWRLTMPALSYRPAEDMGEPNMLPAMSAGYVTFGTLTRGIRINHRVIRVWSEILRRMEGARLVIDSKDFRDGYTQDILAEKFAAHGISRDRLQIGCHSPPWDVLRGMDIGLDCFPHNSGTTLFETLYMGVPYITLAGRPSVGRLGSSILQGTGHPEWIAESEEEYVAKAVELASDLGRLAAQRAVLRTEMERSPLLDEVGFARKVEDAYRGMWEIWCAKGDRT